MKELLFKALKLLAVWVGILIAAFIFLETGFRLFRPAPNPLSFLTQKRTDVLFDPNTFAHNKSSVPGEFEYDTHINRYGFRGKDFAMPKPRGVIRIFAVGDSFTHGVGCGDLQTIPALLEADLRKKGYPVEVVNAGVGCTSPITQYVNVRDIDLKYQPDLVVFFYDMTDLWDDWYSERQAILDKNGEIVRFDVLYKYGKRDWWATATQYSCFLRYLNDRVIRSIAKMQTIGVQNYWKAVREGKRAKAVIVNSTDKRAQKVTLEYDGLLLMRGHSQEALIRQNWPRSEKYLLKIRDLLYKHGVPMVIEQHPHGIYVDGDQWKNGRKTWGFEPGKRYDDYLPFDLMRGFCRKNNIPLVNTLGAFLKAPKDKYFWDWDGHMTPKANIIVASTLANDEGLLKALDNIKSSLPR